MYTLILLYLAVGINYSFINWPDAMVNNTQNVLQ